MKTIASTVAHGEVNAFDMLQKKNHKALSPNMRVLCCTISEIVDHRLLFCPFSCIIWNELFPLVEEGCYGNAASWIPFGP